MPDPNDYFDLPPQLADALRSAYTHHVDIPADLDARIASAAKEQFNHRRRQRMMLRWSAGVAAGIAAAILLAVSLHNPTPAKPLAKGDINADGQLNIVDALTLAKHLANHDRLEKTWDINNDGVIDQKDVDAIAAASVNLKQTTLARRALPKFNDLGIGQRPHVGSALADGIRAKTFAKANPTAGVREARQ